MGFLFLVASFACRPEGNPAVTMTTPAPVSSLSIDPTSEPDVPSPTMEAVDLSSPQPPASPTPLASATPTATIEPAPIIQPTPLDAQGLPCPDLNPTKPDYARYILSVEPWPTPDLELPTPAFSLADPLPGAIRNAGYPYGSDGNDRYLLHNGLDMAHEDKAFAVAAADGTVIVARDDLDEMFGWRCDWYGRLVILKLDETSNDQPVYLLYGHVSDIQVEEGQRVASGDPIARQETAGAAVVAHLHFEVRRGENTFGSTQNPLLWVEPEPGHGIIAGRVVDPDGRAWQGVIVTLIDRRGVAPFVNTWSYLDDPDHLIRPDPSLAENFVFEPVEAGTYDVFTQIQGIDYRQTVEVADGRLAILDIVTEPYRMPTPTP
jgi:murein DD-endopeptidase MepM/ murein hydrolase activator NlpD